MEELIIKIGVPQFVGIITTITLSLIGISWKIGGRLKGIEKDVEKLSDNHTEIKSDFKDFSVRMIDIIGTLKEMEGSLKEIRISKENESVSAFQNNSPLKLTDGGEDLLKKSGLQSYIDQHYSTLCDGLVLKNEMNPYEIQEEIFSCMNIHKFEGNFKEGLMTFSYEKGISMSIMKRIGAIYLRDKYMEENKIKLKEIDEHDPEAPSSLKTT